ncbi:MAG: DUF805 domain-containing protein [Minisyncoccia bacterium]
MSISKYCSNCGKPIFAEDKFCGSCGAKINYSFSEENAESVGNNPPRTEKEQFAKTNSANKQDNGQVKYENIDNTEEQSSFDYYNQVLCKYSDFNGRSTRAEYWYFMLYNIIIAILIAFFGAIIGDEEGVLYILYLFIMLIPHWAVSVRRLHDIGKSGWIFLVGFIPLIGFLWLLILFTTDSESGVNKYGPNPKNNNDYSASEEKPRMLSKKKISAEGYTFFIGVGLIIVGMILQNGVISFFAFCIILSSVLIMKQRKN